jgi:hypothetical protein
MEVLSDGKSVSAGTSTTVSVFRETINETFSLRYRYYYNCWVRPGTWEISVLETAWCVQTQISEMLVPSLTVRLRAVYYPIKRDKRRLNQTAVVKCRRGISREYSAAEQTDLCKTEAGRVYDNPIHRSTNKVQWILCLTDGAAFMSTSSRDTLHTARLCPSPPTQNTSRFRATVTYVTER